MSCRYFDSLSARYCSTPLRLDWLLPSVSAAIIFFTLIPRSISRLNAWANLSVPDSEFCQDRAPHLGALIGVPWQGFRTTNANCAVLAPITNNELSPSKP